jgi:hypothetical protein
MADDTPKKRPLSEIGHLFLSNVRDQHLGGVTPPRRLPPGARAQQPPQPVDGVEQQAAASDATSPPPSPARPNVSIDLTPEEFARSFGQIALPDDLMADPISDLANAPDEPAELVHRPVTAVIAGHLTGTQLDRARQYARHLAARDGRIGLIELDASEFRLMCFEPGATAAPEDATPPLNPDCYNVREITEAIEELNWDIDRWLLVIPNPRTPEAKALLREVEHWVLLATCDHDGVVAAYRMLKGLADHATGGIDGQRPRLTLAVLDAFDDGEVARVNEKLAGVCNQFLGWPVETEIPVAAGAQAAEHLVMFCRPTRDKAQIAAAPQWSIVDDFLFRLRQAPAAGAPAAAAADGVSPFEFPCEARALEAAVAASSPATDVQADDDPAYDLSPLPTDAMTSETQAPARPTLRPAANVAARAAEPAPQPVAEAARTDATAAVTLPPVQLATAPAAGEYEVLDLPGPNASAEAILAAILHDPAAGLVECPVRAPMCAEARLAVARDRGLLLLAVARTGLAELRAIGRAYHWLQENQSLIAMAVPQFSIDPAHSPRLRLLVDQSDLSAEALRPMLQSGHVIVQAYRRLRWGGKTGLLLEAA